MKEVWKLTECQEVLEAKLAAVLAERGESVDDSDDLIEQITLNALSQLTNAFYRTLAKDSRSMLTEHRDLRAGFVKRNISRWRGGFDRLERLIVISQESGSAINDALRPQAVERNDPLFEVVISCHARAVQVSREILTLMIAGFPDGALGRWRTLHEIAVVSNFISHRGKETAERYILHDHVTSYKRAINYMEHHGRANLEPIEQQTLDHLKAAHDEIISRFGASMKHDYGWAAQALSIVRPRLVDLEVATGLDHWRPRYKWATVNTHGAYRNHDDGLATCEAKEPVLSVGESNSGMTDPGHMTAITLTLATMPVLMFEPNIDRLAIANVMDRLSNEIGEIFMRRERVTYERVQRKKAS